MQDGLAEANPCIGTKGQAKRAQRDRVLDKSNLHLPLDQRDYPELRAVWNACNMDTDFGKIIRLLILTGCRREEIGGLMWGEVNLGAGTITLPKERTKNKREHTLALPKVAMDIIRSINPRVGRDHLFGERAIGFRSWQVQKARFKDGIEPWNIHDIRRSVSTHMAEIGVEPHIIEAVLNHYSGHKSGVHGIYNHAKYPQQMKTALALWADHVRSIVTGEPREVIPFRQSA